MRLCNYTLSPTRINNAKPKGKLYKLTDGGGLFIEVSAAGLKAWRYQYRFGGVRREVTIGKFPEVGVADARERHFELRSLLERGNDSLDSRRQKLSEQKECLRTEHSTRRFTIARGSSAQCRRWTSTFVASPSSTDDAVSVRSTCSSSRRSRSASWANTPSVRQRSTASVLPKSNARSCLHTRCPAFAWDG